MVLLNTVFSDESPGPSHKLNKQNKAAYGDNQKDCGNRDLHGCRCVNTSLKVVPGNAHTVKNQHDGNKNAPPNDMGLFTGDRAGGLQGEREKQATLIIIVLIVIVGFLVFVTLLHYKRLGKRKRGS